MSLIRRTSLVLASAVVAVVTCAPSLAQYARTEELSAPCEAATLTAHADSLIAQAGLQGRDPTSQVLPLLLVGASCDTSDGAPWTAIYREALRNENSTLANEALERLYELGYWTNARLALVTWVLESAPENAMLLMQGEDDAVPALMLQQVVGVRPDVSIVHTDWLAYAWSWSTNLEHVELISSIDSSTDARRGKILDALVSDRHDSVRRPLVASITLDPSIVGSRAPGMVDGAAVLWPADSSSYDLEAAARSVALLDGAEFRGPNVSEHDRNPRRNAFPVQLGGIPLFHACQVAVSHAQNGDRDAAEAAYRHAVEFARAAGLEDDALIPIARQWIDDALTPHE